MPKFTVKTAVDHDGKRYESGKTVDLRDEAAEPLLAVDAIEAIEAKKKESESAEGKQQK